MKKTNQKAGKLFTSWQFRSKTFLQLKKKQNPKSVNLLDLKGPCEQENREREREREREERRER